MELKDAILSRRSIRSYTDQPVSREDLEAILDLGMWAPSGVNFQPWYFVAIQSREQMEKLLSVMDGVSTDLEDNLRTRFAKNPEVAEESLTFIRNLGKAPVCILAFRHKPSYTKTDETIVQSIAAAMENILLAAVDRGLGGCWMTAPIETGTGDLLRDMFAPGKGSLVAVMTIGHPARIPKAPARKEGRYIIL